MGTLASATMPGARWFPGSTLNPPQHALADGPGRGDDDLAVVFVREDGLERLLSYGELRDLVGRVRAGLLRLGVGRGDRVVAMMPNCIEAVAAFLAAAPARGDMVVVLTGLRDAGRARSVRSAGTVGFPRSRRLPLWRKGVRRTGARPDTAQQMPSLTATVLVPYLTLLPGWTVHPAGRS